MNKWKFTFALLLVGISSADAAQFRSMNGSNKNCKLAKFVGGKWVQASESEVNGQTITNVSISKANASFSNFKFQNTWYAASASCVNNNGGGNVDGNSSASRGYSGNKPKFYVEAKIEKSVAWSSNSTGIQDVQNTSTATGGAYSSGIDFEGRIGYKLSSANYVFLDLAAISGSQTLTYTQNTPGIGTTGTPAISDSLVLVNIGWQRNLASSFLTTHPYFGASLGYAKLSGTITGTVTGGTLAVGYNASGFDLAVEAGLVKDFNSNWSGVLSLGFTYLSLTPKVYQTNATGLFTTGEALPSRSYSHFALGIGARYGFN